MIKELLNNQVQHLDIKFKYFGTINSHYKQTNIHRVRSRHRELRNSIRRFYNEPIRFFFFVEHHDTPGLSHHGGFHTHFLMEDCSPARWKCPSKRMERFLEEKDPEALFSALSGSEPSDESKVALLKRVVRMVPGVPLGWNGVDIQVINDQEGILRYCSKQAGKQLPATEVIDETNSDIDLDLNWHDWNEYSKQHHRYEVLSA